MKTEQIIAGNWAVLMEYKRWIIYWFSQGQKKEHLNRVREIQYKELSADTERIKKNTSGIKSESSKNIDWSKSGEGTAESSGATRFGNTFVDVQ